MDTFAVMAAMSDVLEYPSALFNADEWRRAMLKQWHNSFWSIEWQALMRVKR